jgi:proteasome lid subunit RPN8/RPN11
VAISPADVLELEWHARVSLPNESCAFLLGSGKEKISISEILPIKNLHASYASFEIPPEELLKAYEYAELKGAQVVGIFHSHPSPPTPSRTDIRFMEINPVVWIIYSTTENRFAAWIFEDTVRQVKMIIVGKGEGKNDKNGDGKK